MKLARATILVSFAALLSRILGVWRENLLASSFGALGQNDLHPLDAYYAAFRIPDFLYNMVILSVGAAIFVPLFAKEFHAQRQNINRIVSNFLNVSFLVLAAGSLFIYLSLPWLLPLLTPGFSDSTRALTGQLIQIMMLSPLCFGMSSIIASYLSVHKDFTAHIWSPLVYNGAIIASIFLVVPVWGIFGLAWGVVLGALLHVVVQLYPLRQVQFQFLWVLDMHMQSLREVGRLVVPRIIGMSAAQFSLIVDTMIASTLTAGSLTILNWTQNLQYLPIGLVGISLSVTAFTLLSDYAAVDDRRAFSATLLKTMRLIIVLSIPMTVGFYLLRYDVVDLILNYGRFQSVQGNLAITGEALGIFIVSLVFQSLIPLLTRAFYAYQDTKTPVLISLGTVALNIIGSLFFVHVLHLGVMGLALSFSISNSINALALLYVLHSHVMRNHFRLPDIGWTVLKTLTASLIMGVVIWLGYTYLLGFGSTKIMILFRLVATTLLGITTFILAAYLFKLEEVFIVIRRIKKIAR